MKISLITCTYNSAKTVADTIRSVNRQAYSDIEHIIVDGLSKDNTMEVIRQNMTDRQRIHQGKDKGIYDAINKGIALATGDVVGILNSDDYLSDPYVIERIVNTFEEENPDAVYGNIHFVAEENLNKTVRKYSSRIFTPRLMHLGFMPAHPSFYIKQSCYEKYGLYNDTYRIGADFELLLRYILIHRIKIKYIPMDFVTMRTGGVSTSGFASHKTIMNEHLRACRENGIYTNRFLLSLRYLYKLTELRPF